MATPMYKNRGGGDSRLVAVEVQGPTTFYVELTKIEKYHQLHGQITNHVPPYVYNHVYHVLGYPYRPDLGPLFINLNTVPREAGHILWDYLTSGTLSLGPNPSKERLAEYFKGIIHAHYVAGRFGMEDLKSDSAKEVFRKAQDMDLMELLKLLEEANYWSGLFPQFSNYLEKRLVGSALDYGKGDSQEAFNQLSNQPSLSVAQMLLKTITKVSNIGCWSGEQSSMQDEVHRIKIAEKMAASEVIGWRECKSPETRWIKPMNEAARESKSVISRLYGPVAKQEGRSRLESPMEQPLQRAAVPEPTLYSSTEPGFIPPPMFVPGLVPRAENNGTGLPPPPFGDTSKTSRSGNPPYCSRVSPMQHERPLEYKRQSEAIPPVPTYRHRKRAALGKFESVIAAKLDNNAADEAAEVCGRPVAPIGSQLRFSESAMPSVDEPPPSSTSSSATLGHGPVEGERSMDWDGGRSQYDHTL